MGATYPAFFCDVPADEPTCVPARSISVSQSGIYDGTVTSADTDGDGVLNEADNCPRVFNPPRPGLGVQSDTDADGMGDPCDPCPFDTDPACIP